MRRFRPLFALVLLVAALVSWRMVEHTEPLDRPIAHSGPREVDHYVTGFDVIRMTPSGQPAHRLRAASLRHYIDDDTTELDHPRLTVFQAEEPPWQVDAERAWVSADGSLVLLDTFDGNEAILNDFNVLVDGVVVADITKSRGLFQIVPSGDEGALFPDLIVVP